MKETVGRTASCYIKNVSQAGGVLVLESHQHMCCIFMLHLRSALVQVTQLELTVPLAHHWSKAILVHATTEDSQIYSYLCKGCLLGFPSSDSVSSVVVEQGS